MEGKEGRKLLGRFIRKRDPVLEHVQVLDYNLIDISVTPTSIPDNANNTIIHTRLHSPQSIEASIKESPIQNEVFENEVSRRPIIAPKDFTKDWERLKRRTSRRMIKLDDDEELELEMEYLREKESLESEISEKQKEEPKEGNSNLSNSPNLEELDRAVEEVAESLGDQDDNFDKSMLTISSPKQEDNSDETNITVNDSENEIEKEEINDIIVDENQQGDDEQDRKNESSEINDVNQKLIDEAFEKGRVDALNSVKEEFEAAANAINGIFSDLEGLKTSLLTNSQENFRNICESLIESLLEKEFSINPEAFGSIIERAVNEATKDDEFQIHINPKLYDKLKENLKEDVAARLVADEGVGLGDFQLDSKSGVVDGSLKTIISDLLNKADVKLTIDTDEDAS